MLARPSPPIGFWDEFNTTWACFDCELMPWSAKAQELLRSQYAAVGAAGNASLPQSPWQLAEQAAERLNGEARQQLDALAAVSGAQIGHCERFVAAYRQYCWPVESLDDLKLAPFHLLATEGKRSRCTEPRLAHGNSGKMCAHDPSLLLATRF